MAIPLMVPIAAAGGVAALWMLQEGWKWGEEQAGLAYQTWWPWAEQPGITPPDLLPIAPQVSPGMVFSPETQSVYAGERRLRDVEIARQATANGGQLLEPFGKLPGWLLPVAIGLGAFLVLRR